VSLKFESRLFAHLQHDRYRAATVEEAARDLGISDADLDDFAHAVRALAKAGRITLDGAGRIRLPAMPDTIIGTFRRNPRGFGFVIPDQPYVEGDLFIPPDAVADALTGDTVRAAVNRSNRFGRDGDREVAGEIIEVLERKRASFTGELTQRGSQWLVYPDGRELTQPIVVQDPSVKNARPGDKVVVEITRYPETMRSGFGGRGGAANGAGLGALGEGVITKVLGEAGLPDVETQATIEAFGLPTEFPKECVEQARAATKRFEEEVGKASTRGYDKHERIDLTQEFICTIDPPDAKDFDDAISIRRTADGWELGVHIADVAHFIEPGSALDLEARKRGNSVYLPRLVIPMQPEVLSNGICSLAEGVVRFCKSAFMSYDHDGNIITEHVAATAIKSAKRLTYLEAQALIDGDLREARKHAKTEPRYSDELIKTLREMDKLAKAIRHRRRKAGMIHLELPEVVLVYDDAGHVIDAVPEDDAFTHTIIEMFMVEANEVLARLFDGLGVPLLRRVHPEPTPGDVGDLRQMARVAGYTIPKNPTRQELQALLDATAGTPAARAVHFAVLRTLTKAEYSPADIGHFALASEAYAHFTSPIRRYPDLTVHRALAEYLRQTDNGHDRPRNDKARRKLGLALIDAGPKRGLLLEDELIEIGRHCTQTEANAEAAEQSLRQFLVLQLLTNHLGEAFDGIVTGVSNAGVFVQIEKYLADGMIKTADLPTGSAYGGGRWTIDQRSGALVNPSTGKSFAVGDRIQVMIARIDLPLRKMDLIVADPRAGKAAHVGGKHKTDKSGKSGKADKNLAVAAATPAAGKHARPGPNRVERDDFDPRRKGKTGADRRAKKSRELDQNKKDHRRPRRKRW
jgi:ribonuclease R